MRISQLIARSAALCAFAAAGAAHAQSMSVNVTGTIVPPACSAQIVGGGNLDWGQISHNSLSSSDFTVLSPQQVSLQVQCDAGLKTHMAFWAVDTNPSSALTGKRVAGSQWPNGDAQDRIFGLGMDPITGQKLGNFTMLPVSSAADGSVRTDTYGFVTTSTHTETTFATGSFGGSGLLTTADYTIYSASGTNPAQANTFTFTMAVYPQLNKSGSITNAQEVPFGGTAQFYVRYF